MRGHKRALTRITSAAIIVLGLLVALGLLSAGVYAVFNSTNGAGTAALLTVGSLALFVVFYHDRIRSMEFGGAKMQFALKIKDC
jgi:ABC-type nickel/cobalt efflux system permease component RcnA